MMSALAEWLSNSPVRDFSASLLSSNSAFPPVLQTIHLLSIVAIMASIVMIDLRILGLAVPSQDVGEMIARLCPWTLWGIVGAASSGIWFILARPNRYFSNPVFQIKFGLLAVALILTFAFYRWGAAHNSVRRGLGNRVFLAKVYALVSLLLWLGVVMAGRWIAYSEYLFWPV
jgi:hypothetical protein